MSNQNFKMILTGPITSMGDVVNCVTGHGGKIEMVELEEAPVIERKAVAEKPKRRRRLVTSMDVYRSLMNPDVVQKTSAGIARYLSATLGEDVGAGAVGTHLYKLRKCGVVKVVAGLGTRRMVYGVANSGVSPDVIMQRVVDYEKANR